MSDYPIVNPPVTLAPNAAEVSVAASPVNYTAEAAQVESHLAGIDTTIGGLGGGHAAVTLNASLTDILALSTQELQAVDAGAADAFMVWDDSAGKVTYFNAATARTLLNVEDGATADSTDQFLFGFSITNTVSPITVGELKSFRVPVSCVLTRIFVGGKTAPTGSAVTFDVEDGGTSLLNAVLSVAISGFSSETSTFTGSASNYPLTKGDVVTVDCDQKDSDDVAREFDISFFGYQS